MGGLGIKSAVHLAPSAFLASADGSLDFVNQILPHRLHNTPYQERVEACHQWEVGLDIPPPTPPVSFKQKVWNLPRVKDRADSLLSDTNDARSRVRLLAVSTKVSGTWLKALPISSLGLRMDDETLRIAIGLRLGCLMSLPHICAHCGEHVDQSATHGLSCKWSQGGTPDMVR